MSDDVFVPSFVNLQQRLTTEMQLPYLDDQLQWAELCVRAELPKLARALFESNFMREGVSTRQMRRWREIAAQTGLWEAFPDAPQAPTHQANNVGIALAELRDFVGAAVPFMKQAAKPADADAMPHQVRLSGPHGDGDSDADVLRAHALFALLTGPAPDDWSDADRLLAAIAAATDAMMPVDWRTVTATDLATMARLLTLANLQEFVAANRHLFDKAQNGSAALLWRAARFDSAGLGPYFSNVSQLARRSKDIFELAYDADDAARAAGIAVTSLPHWLFLLSDRLRRPLMFEVIDDLGDRGEMTTLSLIYGRLAARVKTDAILVGRIRDAALDNQDYAFAARVQLRLVDAVQGSATELAMLGEILGSGGFVVAAEQAFTQSLLFAPEQADIAIRLAALRKHEFAPFALKGGYDTPEDRRINRSRCRSSGSRTAQTADVVSHPLAVEFH